MRTGGLYRWVAQKRTRCQRLGVENDILISEEGTQRRGLQGIGYLLNTIIVNGDRVSFQVCIATAMLKTGYPFL